MLQTTPAAPLPDEFKNDYQNALKRKLKMWAEWREDVNNVLAQVGDMFKFCSQLSPALLLHLFGASLKRTLTFKVAPAKGSFSL